MELLIELVILVSAVAFIGYPLFNNKYLEMSLEGSRMDNYQKLLSSKDMTLAAIKDLEFDYMTGKLSENDFNELKVQYESEAVSILKEIDNQGKSSPAAKKKNKKGPKQKGSFCTQCGEGYQSGDKFCASCGNKLASS